ncbi:MAG: eukaryotic-like serine/threonine-protein kinase [Thermoanaerobaculia bacterium]|jgi:TolB-like protein/Flp pilus assembly protein TadD|nr:eukaryotic-like serine/threonine-protein kinase [Thermoanaerobaculia bacterium]
MQLVEGQTIESLIVGGGMEVSLILNIASSLADALVAAHAKGIIHRDLKPANLMLTREQRLKVLDFGLAKVALPGADGQSDADLPTDMKTKAGTVMGTMPYMSPEQVRGESVDERTDIFSCGVILYELATGSRPFQGRSAPELASAILRDTPRPAAELRAGLPDRLLRIIDRCLQKKPEDRFTATELRDVLRGVGADTTSSPSEAAKPVALLRFAPIALVIALLAVASTWFVQHRHATASTEMTLAVLPIQILGGDKSAEYLADGVTTELSGALKKIPGLQVAGDLSTFRFKGTRTDPADIARQLGVAMLLTGKLQHGTDRIRLQMQLSSADGKLLWSNQFDRPNRDNFAMQDEITSAIASEMRLVLSPKTLAVARAGRTENPEAHDFYMRGEFEKNKVSPQGLANALVFFNKALELDPNYAQAHAGVAFVYDMQADMYAPSHEYHTLGLAAARRAVESDPTLAEGHLLLGYELAAALWDFQGGRAEMDRALAMEPNSPDALFMIGIFSALSGDKARAIELADRLIKVDPLSPLASHLRAEALLWAGRYEEALEQNRAARKLDPTLVLFDSVPAIALRELGRLDESLAAYQDFQKFFDQPSFGLATTYARMGRKSDALAVIHALEERERKQWVDPDFIALAYAGIGDRDHAMEWLEKAFHRKTFGVRQFLGWDCPWLRNMEPDPRYQELKRRVLATKLQS